MTLELWHHEWRGMRLRSTVYYQVHKETPLCLSDELMKDGVQTIEHHWPATLDRRTEAILTIHVFFLTIKRSNGRSCRERKTRRVLRTATMIELSRCSVYQTKCSLMCFRWKCSTTYSTEYSRMITLCISKANWRLW